MTFAGRACVAALAVALASPPARATPLYASRAGRACDNCHLTPNAWENPRLAQRKCTLSCIACHADPAGGGMRTTSGRFYGRSTLAAIATSPRPTQDWDRELLPWLYRKDRATSYTDSLQQGPRNSADVRSRPWPVADRWALGRSRPDPGPFAPWSGRFGALNADPRLRIAWDVRVAALFDAGAVFFPMQTDLGVLVHPIEHISLLTNLGARGRTAGIDATLHDAHTPYLREAFVLVHELPFLAHVKLGRFTPRFGLRLDDHTALTRRTFALDAALPETRVTGVEIGVNPNYPYLSLAAFRGAGAGRVPAAFDPFDVDSGWGGTLDLGYRAEGWNAGTSALVERRSLAGGGDVASFALYGALNPWRRWRHVPLTLLGEIDVGTFDRASGRTARRVAVHQEVAWLVANGVNALAAYDASDPDTAVRDDHAQRWSLGLQLVPIPGITLDGRGRLLFPAGDLVGADFFLQVHCWN
jgi:hypothetical protein